MPYPIQHPEVRAAYGIGCRVTQHPARVAAELPQVTVAGTC